MTIEEIEELEAAAEVYVRARWAHVDYYKGGGIVPVVSIKTGEQLRKTFGIFSDPWPWTQAKAFTEKREMDIKERREEIVVMRELIGFAEISTHLYPLWHGPLTRLLQRSQPELDVLLVGFIEQEPA